MWVRKQTYRKDLLAVAGSREPKIREMLRIREAANSGDDADTGDAAESGALLLLNCGAASADTTTNNNIRICKLETLIISKKAKEEQAWNVNWIYLLKGVEKKAERAVACVIGSNWFRSAPPNSKNLTSEENRFRSTFTAKSPKSYES